MTAKIKKIKYSGNNILYTLIATTLLCLVFLLSIGYVYLRAEKEGFEALHMETKQIKDDISLQVKSDQENLITLASIAAELYESGQSYDLIFNSFEPIGLIKSVGILLPDNTFISKRGVLDFNGKLSYDEEIKKGSYISGRVKDVTNSEIEIIRSAVPIMSGDTPVGIMYGSIMLNSFLERYHNMTEELDAQLYVYEKGNGNFLIDTLHDKLGNIEDLKHKNYKKGFSYKQMMSEEKGYSAFMSQAWGDYLYVHYSPIGVSDWQILLGRREQQVFANVRYITMILVIAFVMMVLIISIYLLFVFSNDRKLSKINGASSKVRKLLLEINQQNTSINDSLRNITFFAKSRSTFFVDTDGEDYNFIASPFEGTSLAADERKYLISELLKYAATIHVAGGTTVGVMTLSSGSHLEEANPELNKFLTEHNMQTISFAAVANKNNHISILGSINAEKEKEVRILLQDIAVCFSIAIYNKKHLNRTERAAATDSLTGLYNRVTYKKDVIMFDEEKPENFACIYIDVNELHMHNTKYGHAAGDEMLIYIANTMKEVFFGHFMYRMGGDEFLVFAKGVNQDEIGKAIEDLIKKLKPANYHVAIGMSYRTQNVNTDEMVREAEVRMYEAKSKYYQSKEVKCVSATESAEYKSVNTGIKEIDTLLSVMQEHYNGIYRVKLSTDEVHRILMPSYLGYSESEKYFEKLFIRYVNESVDPDFHRAMLSFLNYESLKRQLTVGSIPQITYKKTNGETVVLKVYSLDDEKEVDNTLWVFAKE